MKGQEGEAEQNKMTNMSWNKKGGEEILFWGFIQMRLLVNEKLNTLSSV